MKQFKICSLLILTFSITISCFGQINKSEQQLTKYFQKLKSSKVDTILSLKSGCTGCDVKYADTLTGMSDGQSIYVLTQKSGNFMFAIFNDMNNPIYFFVDTCSLFKFINQTIATLRLKEKFYKAQIPKIKSKSGFYSPSPIHHLYKELTISSPNFNYNFITINGNKDHFGLEHSNEKWFALTNQIIKRVCEYSKLAKY